MDKRDAGKLRYFPARRLLKRVMHLHIALAVAVLRDGLRHLRRHFRVGEETAIKLVGRDRADHAARRLDLSATGQLHATRGARIVEHNAIDVSAKKNVAALVADQLLESRERVLRAAFDDRRAG